MQVNNINSQNFTGIKYQHHNVVNTWYSYRLKKGGKNAVSKMEQIIESQKNNPYHIVLNYTGNDKKVKEFTTVNGKEFVRNKFESMVSLLKRSAKYADSLNKNANEQPMVLEGLKDFVLQK